MTGLFDTLSNVFGKLPPDIRKRLQAVIDKPSQRTWDNAFSIIIEGEQMMTLWQAVIAVEPFFTRTGKRTDQNGKVIAPWPEIPDRETIIKALLYASKPKQEDQRKGQWF